ncbi:MAG: alpha-2-macroglobulin [Acidobacteria bacterium]|nr:alpha-2-macroglobulin [Acidobacteriota bacterium]
MSRPSSRLRRRAAAAVWICLSLLAASQTGAAAPKRSGPVVVPDRFLRRWDPVTVFFNQDPRGEKAGKPGPEDHPERFVRMAPAHPGAWTWVDARTLQFKPAEPWPPLQRFRFTVGNAPAITLDTLISPPAKTLPAENEEVADPVKAITLVFPEPLETQTLGRMLSIEVRPLPGVARGAGGAGAEPRWITARDFQVKALDRKERNDPAPYVVTLATPIPLGSKAVLHFRLSLGEAAPESSLDLAFTTAEPFRVVSLGCSGSRVPVTAAGTRYGREQALRCGPDDRQVVVELSAAPVDLGPIEGRNLVRFEPAVSGLTFEVSGRQLLVSGSFERETLYRVSLAPAAAGAVVDGHGRRLDLRGSTETFLVFPQRESYLRWSASQGIVERFGPRMAPIEGRGDERLDLRLYPIDPLDRSLWPFPDSPVAVDEGKRPPGPGEEPAPWKAPERNVPASELALHLQTLGSPPVSTLVTLPLRREGSSARFGLDLGPYLDKLAPRGAPGTYLVGLRRIDRSSQRSWLRVQVTDLTLTVAEEPRAVVFAVNSLSTSLPVGGAKVRVEGSVKEAGGEARWTTFFEGTTDAAGRVAWNPPGHDSSRSESVRRIVVQNGNDLLVLDPGHAPDGYADGQWSPTHQSWLGWVFDDLAARGPQAETLCHLFTERPVYRPEDGVHVKGYLRRREKGELTPVRPEGRVIVQGPGDLVWRYPVEVTAAGSFYKFFKEEKLPTGVYSARFEDKDGHSFGSVSWRMEAYRLPRFEVRLDAPDRVPLDREFKVGLTGIYYAGGRVAGRPVAWRVTQFPYTWTPKHRSGFLYSSDGRFSRTATFESTPRLEKRDTTDAEGAAKLVLNPAVEPTAQPRSYVVEATVTGADDQTVTATRQIVALPPFVLGLKVPRFLERATQIRPEVLVVGLDDKPVAGMEVKVRLLQRQWHSHLRASDFSDGVARYMTDVVDEKVHEVKVKSGAEALAVPLAIPRSGVYIVEIEASDRLGRTQVVKVDLYAGGDQAVTWTKPPAGVFTVTSDKASYQPGETAALVLQSPFQKGEALAVIEAPEGNRYEWVAVEGGAATFNLPIRGNWAPRIPVHFVLMRGRVPGTGPQPGNSTDLGKPATVAATTWLKVEPAANRVDVKLTHPEKARPGQKVEIRIDLRDPQGNPRPGEVTLWLVDQAVLALGKEQRLDPLPDFITKVLSHLTVRDTRNLVFGFLPFAENPGGDQGGTGEGSLLDRATVRRNFKAVPYFNPNIQVGPDGTTKVAVELPDDVTVFKIRAKAASGPDRFGFGTSQIAVRLPIVIQPALPRFVRPGDRFLASGIGRIVEGDAGPGKAEIRVQGVELGGPAKKTFTWTDQPERLEFPVTVPTPPFKADGTLAYDRVAFTFGVERTADGASDAFEVKLPVRDDRRPIQIRLMKELAAGSPLAIPALPEPARPGSVRRSVLVSDQAALVRMAAGLDFFNQYPYGCTEQRLSQARAEMALKRFRVLLHQEGDDGRMKRAVEDTLQWLPQVVDPHGLVAYWPGSNGYVSLTAWVVQFLVEAKAAGFRVDDKLMATLTRSLEQSLRSDYGRFIDGEGFAERCWALAALAAAGKFDPAYAAELARKAQLLDLEGVAEVLQSFAKSGDTTSPATDALAEKIWSGVVLRLYQGKEIYGGLQKTATARNGLILPTETRTVAEVARALARKDGKNPRLQLLVDALVTLGRDDGWGTTNANAAALLALGELLQPPYAGSAPHALQVKLGGGAAQALSLGPDAPVGYLVSTDGSAGSVAVQAGSTGRPVLARIETRYLPAGDGARVAAKSDGFVVSREMLKQVAGGAPPERIPLAEPGRTVRFAIGDVIEEHLRVVNPKDRNFVAIVVPLAAGLEPLNPALATAPPEARPSSGPTLKPTYVAFLDDQVAYYYDTLPKGTFDFYFRTRATIEGSYVQPAGRAEMMYDGAVTGNSAGARIEVVRQEK